MTGRGRGKPRPYKPGLGGESHANLNLLQADEVR
jgi:hypothetical protein